MQPEQTVPAKSAALTTSATPQQVAYESQKEEASVSISTAIESTHYDLPPAICIGIPIVSLLILWIVPLFGQRAYDILIPHEIGFLEIGTVVFLIPAIVLGVLCFLRRRHMPKGVGWIMLLAAIAALYFAGEETNWGQTYFHWKTPDVWANLNKQNETNLHNLELKKYGWYADLVDDLLSNVPRQIMLIFCLVGGIILPLVLRRRLSRPTARQSVWYWLIPTQRLIPAALLAVVSAVPEKIYRVLKHTHNIPNWLSKGRYAYLAFVDPAGEFKEYCFAMVMLFYLLSVYIRVRHNPISKVVGK